MSYTIVYSKYHQQRIDDLTSTVATNKSDIEASLASYQSSNDTRSTAIEAQAVADKAELQTNIDAVSSQLTTDKASLDASIAGLDTRLSATEVEIGDKVNDYLNSNIDQRVLTTTFEAVKTSLEAQDTAFAAELASNLSEANSKHNAQAVVLNELVRLVQSIYDGFQVEDSNGDPVVPDAAKLTDTTTV